MIKHVNYTYFITSLKVGYHAQRYDTAAEAVAALKNNPYYASGGFCVTVEEHTLYFNDAGKFTGRELKEMIYDPSREEIPE